LDVSEAQADALSTTMLTRRVGGDEEVVKRWSKRDALKRPRAAGNEEQGQAVRGMIRSTRSGRRGGDVGERANVGEGATLRNEHDSLDDEGGELSPRSRLDGRQPPHPCGDSPSFVVALVPYSVFLHHVARVLSFDRPAACRPAVTSFVSLEGTFLSILLRGARGRSALVACCCGTRKVGAGFASPCLHPLALSLDQSLAVRYLALCDRSSSPSIVSSPCPSLAFPPTLPLTTVTVTGTGEPEARVRLRLLLLPLLHSFYRPHPGGGCEGWMPPQAKWP